jgi:hypothetical protein
MLTTTITDSRKNIKDYIDSVIENNEPVLIPYIDTSKPVSERLIRSCYPKLPTAQQISNDPRKAAALGL